MIANILKTLIFHEIKYDLKGDITYKATFMLIIIILLKLNI